MAAFVINPHGRLQEWIADEKGYFAQAGLPDYRLESHGLITKDSAKNQTGSTVDNKQGAYQTYEAGREASISCACHWTVNMAASAEHGRLWGECYSISPCGIYVPEDSDVRKPQDLAGVPVHVGYQSGSHYTTIQALEPFIKSDQIKLTFGGNPSDRVDQMLDGTALAATVFGPQSYVVEQLGFRKVLDCTFMIAAMVPAGVDTDDVRKYYEALRMAQADIDLHHQTYLHYYRNELPARHADMVDIRRFGPGERIVFEPYSKSIYETTHRWVEERGIFDAENIGRGRYEDAVVRLAA